MSDHMPGPTPAKPENVVYIYRIEEETSLPVIVGRVFIDENKDAWVQINETDLAEGIGVENIDGVALMDRDRYNGVDN